MTRHLSLEGVSAYYGNAKILHAIDLQIGRGEIVCLLGLNGMGKTTTLRTIMGLVERTEGRISIDGTLLVGPTYRRARMGVTLVPEDRKVFPNLTVEENMAVAAKPMQSGAGLTLERVLKLFPRLEERLRQKGGTLSGGEQQMLVMARAMLSNPKFMLLDEPTEGLAPSYVEAIRDSILAARECSIGVLLVEQSLPLARSVGDTFLIMENGEITFRADRAAIEADPALLERRLTIEEAA
jgi:ABC-type branched-subunit amino acid transport system ATPase component